MRTSKKSARYVVRYEPIEDGWWLATVPQVSGCLTQGRSLRQTRERIREALSLYVGDAGTAELVDEITLPADLATQRKQAKEARGVLEAAQRRANDATAAAVVALVERGLSMRDVAELLEISHQRVAQIAAEARA